MGVILKREDMGQLLERGVLSKFLEKSCVGGKRGNTHTVKFDRKREKAGVNVAMAPASR